MLSEIWNIERSLSSKGNIRILNDIIFDDVVCNDPQTFELDA